MPRFYVRNESAPEDRQWNIFSTVTDDFLFENWMSFSELCGEVISETMTEKLKDMLSLLTDDPLVNTMTYTEALEEVEWRKVMDEEVDEEEGNE